MILITGAGGKTGRAILNALAAKGEPVRAWAHREAQVEALKASGAADVVVGDMRDEVLLRRAMSRVRAVYHICPNVHPDEVAIGEAVITAAKASGVEHFVYHSVLHPQTESMPHHWNKLRVEESILEAGLVFTILQPTAYMQNLVANWDVIVKRGVYAIPYPVETRLSLVDLDDVAEAAALVLTEPGHANATYELVGTPPLTQSEVAGVLSERLGRPVRVEAQTLETWAAWSRATGLDEYALQTLLQMFRYYARYGLVGNPNALKGLLKRPPTSLAEFVTRTAHDAEPRRRVPRYCEG